MRQIKVGKVREEVSQLIKQETEALKGRAQQIKEQTRKVREELEQAVYQEEGQMQE